jgi:hypothetical protein
MGLSRQSDHASDTNGRGSFYNQGDLDRADRQKAREQFTAKYPPYMECQFNRSMKRCLVLKLPLEPGGLCLEWAVEKLLSA